MVIPRTVAAFGVPTAVAAVLRLWDLGAVGFGNLYYAATVKTMTGSLAAFLYGSFDPELFVSVDKPAPGLWPQAIAAKLFGFSSLALLLPQALSGIASVVVLGRVVGRDHGTAAGVIAAVALAIAPVAVAVDRNNTMDAELVLVLLLAAWCALRSLDMGLRWLVLAGALVGLGFEIKMSQAYLVVPAIGLTYLIAARPRVLARIAHVVAFAVVVMTVSAVWIVFVDLTPGALRPYVGGSTDNTVLELAIGHNGLERLPQELLFWRRPSQPGGPPPNDAPLPAGGTPPQPANGGTPDGSGPTPPNNPIDEAGERGPLRLFNVQLAGQVSWYIPLALAGALAVFVRDGRRWPLTRRQASVVLWLSWLVPAAVLFSWSGIFHRYYLVMLAPPLAALVGAGVMSLVALARTSRTWQAVALATAVVTAALQVLIVSRAGDFASWLIAVAVVGVIACALAFLPWPRLRPAALAFAMACLFAAPVVWAATTLAAFDAALPYAGPDLLTRVARPGGPPAPYAQLTPVGPNVRPAVPPGNAPSPLFDYLIAQHRGERWLAATSSEMTAAMWMLRADVAVMALGGFSGGDPILTPATLEAKMRAGELRFVLIEDRMRADLGAWVRSRCVEVPPARFGGPPLGPPAAQGQAQSGVFDCARVRQAP